MKTRIKQKLQLAALLSITLLFLNSCAPQIELTSSWANKTAKVKSAPMVMVMVIGKDLASRKNVEDYIVAELVKGGHKAIASLNVFKPEVQKYDSATMVSLLRQNNIDMLLTNGVVNVSEQERYVPGTTERVAVGTYATPNNPNYNGYYNGVNNGYNQYNNNYYNSYNNYQTVYEERTTPGYTVVDVEVLIESNLYDVATPELLWFGQSKSYTKEPSTELFNEFARMIVADITKNNLLVK